MQNQKSVRFLILIITTFVFSLPYVFAQIFPGYFYSNYLSYSSLQTLYFTYQGWIDFFIFFMMTASAARFGLMKLMEHKEVPGAAGIYLSVGAMGGLGIALGFQKYNISILDILPIMIIIGFFLAAAAIYMILGKKDKMSIWPALGFLFLSLILTMLLFPQIFQYISAVPLLFDIIWLLIIIGLPLSILFLVVWMASKISIGGGGGGSGSSRGTSRKQEGSHWYKPSTWFGRGAKTLDVRILITPEMSRYPVGTTLTLAADVRKLAIHKSREGLKRGGTYVCQWYINNILLQEKDQIISYTLPPDLITQPVQKVKISVHLVDTETPESEGKAITEIIVVNNQVLVPTLKIKNPSQDLTIKENQVLPVKLEYELNPQDVPIDVIGYGWFITRDIVSIDERRRLFELHPIKLAEGNNVTVTFGQPPLNLVEGTYTLFVIALRKLGNKWLEWADENGTPLFDRKTVYVVHSDPTPTGREIPKINVYKRTGPKTKVNPGRTQIGIFDKNGSIDADVGDVLYFEPIIDGGSILSYTIQWKYPPKPERWAENKYKMGTLVISTPGTKEVICNFQHKDSAVTNIRIKINVSLVKSQIKIVLPAKREYTMTHGYPIINNQNIKLKADIIQNNNNEIKEIWWAIKSAKIGLNLSDPNTLYNLNYLTISTLGKAIDFQIPDISILPPGKYLLIAVGADVISSTQGKIVTYDFIVIEIVKSGASPSTSPYGPYGYYTPGS